MLSGICEHHYNLNWPGEGGWDGDGKAGARQAHGQDREEEGGKEGHQGKSDGDFSPIRKYWTYCGHYASDFLLYVLSWPFEDE